MEFWVFKIFYKKQALYERKLTMFSKLQNVRLDILYMHMDNV